MIGKAIAAVFGAATAFAVLMPPMQKNRPAVVDGQPPTMTEQQLAKRAARTVFDWKVVFPRAPRFGSDTGSDADFAKTDASRASYAGVGKVGPPTTVRLMLDKLDRGGWSVRLTVEPARRD